MGKNIPKIELFSDLLENFHTSQGRRGVRIWYWSFEALYLNLCLGKLVSKLKFVRYSWKLALKVFWGCWIHICISRCLYYLGLKDNPYAICVILLDIQVNFENKSFWTIKWSKIGQDQKTLIPVFVSFGRCYQKFVFGREKANKSQN